MRILIVRCSLCHLEIVVVRSAGGRAQETAIAAVVSGDIPPGASVSEVVGLCGECVVRRSGTREVLRRDDVGDDAHEHVGEGPDRDIVGIADFDAVDE